MQNEMSIEDQVMRCREAVAERGKFDALMVWKFGHLERSRSDWFERKHEAIVAAALFEQCQNARAPAGA